ncbi:MAG: FKBP-type peptidyl-prolyl cis-trans isomerase [Bdellovibrionales bacterium]|nr:FKBP-type peptidyl-prolyl cis-trans isomerase [Bdellovibrionales bacterium]
MKFQRVLVIVAVPALAFQLACDRKPKLDNDKAKLSYAVGQNIAQNIKAQNIDLDPKVVGYAVQQGLKGEKPEVSQEDQQKAIQNLQQQAQAKAMADATNNEKLSSEFLTKNKDKQGVKATSTGLQYEVLKEGKGKKPGLKDKVTVHYTGTLINGNKFDSSHDRGQPAEFPLNGIIKGWQEALQLMPEGSVYRLYIPPNLAYGQQAQPGIPPNSVLVFDVELIKVNK